MHFRRSKFAKEFEPAAFCQAISVGAKGWRAGSRSPNLWSSPGISQLHPNPRLLRRRKLLRLRQQLLRVQDRQCPRPRRVVDCRGNKGTPWVSSAHSHKQSQWSLLGQLRHSRSCGPKAVSRIRFCSVLSAVASVRLCGFWSQPRFTPSAGRLHYLSKVRCRI